MDVNSVTLFVSLFSEYVRKVAPQIGVAFAPPFPQDLAACLKINTQAGLSEAAWSAAKIGKVPASRFPIITCNFPGMKYLSLFSGIGGFELGMQRSHSDWTCVGYSEIDPHALEIYKRHFPNHTLYGDITALSPDGIPPFDLLYGGFPCQAFSVAGKRRGFDDPRGTLFFEIERLLSRRSCRYLLLENVKGLLSHDGGRSFRTILSSLAELGYDLQWQVLNSSDFGVPQNRERVYLFGHLGGTPRPKIFPLTGCHTQDIGFDRNRAIHLRRSKKARKPPSGCYFFAHLASGENGIVTNWASGDTTDRAVRRLTPIECERLQGFPDRWTEGISETQRYKSLGNAVTVNVIEAITARLTDAPGT